MCGRFTLRTPARNFADLFYLAEIPDLRPRYNIVPTQPVAAVRSSPKDGHRELIVLHCCLIPFWADDPKVGYSTINARAETVAAKPTCRQAFAKRLPHHGGRLLRVAEDG
jgi:putative SOS response-associated peptidase YedK